MGLEVLDYQSRLLATSDALCVTLVRLPPAAARPRLVVPEETTDTSNHRYNNSVEDKDAACGLGCRRHWR